MKTITSFLFGGIFLLLSATSCIDFTRVMGNGIPASESRTVSTFSKVKSSGDFSVYIYNGDETNVDVKADENLLQYIETYVSGGTLHIDIQGVHDVKTVIPMEIYITTPQLSGIVQSGSGTITSDYFESNQFELVLSGSGRIEADFDTDLAEVLLSGSGKINMVGLANNASLTISGSGDLNGSDLQVKNCQTLTSGSGNMWISVSDNLSSRISGSGNVYYSGNPTIHTSISGSGKVISNY
ncbi:MAG TPA: head GIN domain-containing protein [Draconibacterium sp.]|nr:head GIN domain-containing protein [Draconibacterium sp.]